MHKVAYSQHASMLKAVFGVKYMSIVWGGIQSIKLRAQPLSVASLLLELQYFLTLLFCAMIKQESVCWWIPTAVKRSRTHLQRGEQHIINKEQFIHNLSSSWWTYQHRRAFRTGNFCKGQKLVWDQWFIIACCVKTAACWHICRAQYTKLLNNFSQKT